MSPRFKILLFEAMHAKGTQYLRDHNCEVLFAASLDEDSLCRQVETVDGIIIRANGAVTRKVIEAAPRLKVIGRHGVGLECIDLVAAREHGIQVVYTPTANTESVAEHFVVLALMLAKKVRLADAALRRGYWQARHELIGTEMSGKTLGILGCGRIGQQTARICRRGLDMRIIYWDQLQYPEFEREVGAEQVGLEQLFGTADFVSINLPLVPATRHLVTSDLLRLMRPGSFVINMARGPIWREADVVEALTKGWIAGAAADVFEMEPPPADHPLFDLDNFIGTPHMAAHTEESLARMSMVAADVVAVLRGEPPQHPVPMERP